MKPSFKQLKQTAWLIIAGKHYQPNEISYSSLPEIYKATGYDLRVLADILGFKADEIKALRKGLEANFLQEKKIKKSLRSGTQNKAERQVKSTQTRQKKTKAFLLNINQKKLN